MRKRAGIIFFCFIMILALCLINLQLPSIKLTSTHLCFHSLPTLPFYLQPSLVWAETSRLGLSALSNNSEHFFSETSEKSQPSKNMDLLQEKLIKKSPSPPYHSGNFTSYMLKASFSLAVVLVIILAVSYLLKKYYLKGNLFGGKFIHLLDTCRLGSKKSLVLTRVENQTLLLGITGQQITLLSQMPFSEKSTPQKIKDAASNKKNFAKQLSENSTKLQQNQSKNSTADIAGILEDRFKELKKI